MNVIPSSKAVKIVLRWKRGTHPRTMKPQWEASANGKIYLTFNGGPQPSNDGEQWVCIERIQLNERLVVVSLEERFVSQTQRRKAHRLEMKSGARQVA